MAVNREDIHNYDLMLESYLKKVNESEEINECNRKLLQDYHKANVMDGLASPTQVKHLQVMFSISKRLNGRSLEELEKPDIEDLVLYFRQMPKSLHTKHKNIVCMKKFYKWLNGGVYPEKVGWVHSNMNQASQKLPEELISLEEVKKMLNACENARDQCFISLLNELGCRIGEILPIKLKHLTKEEQFYRITLQKSKTKPRRLKVIDSSYYIGRWLNKHPTNDPEDYFFVGIGSKNKGKRWEYGAARMALVKIAKRASVKKAVYPHNFRHSTATRYAQKMTSAQLCYWFGWVQGSRVSQIYIHLAGTDLDDIVDEMRGLKKRETKQLTLNDINCKYCKTQNPGNLDFCKNCGAVLTTEGGVMKDDEMDTFKKDMEARQKAVEEYMKFQSEKIKRFERMISEKGS